MATITYNTQVSAITQTGSIVTVCNPVPFAVDLSDDGEKVFLTIEKDGTAIVSGLKMLQLSARTFCCDIADIMASVLTQQNVSNASTTSETMPKFKLVVQAEKNGTITTQNTNVYAIPESRQFREEAFICAYGDAQWKAKLCPSDTYFASVGRPVFIYSYAKSGSNVLNKNSKNFVFNSAGVQSATVDGVTHTVIVEPICSDDIVLTFLNHRSEYRQVNFGRYYAETTEQGEATDILRPYVKLNGIASGLSDLQTLHVQGTRKITITKRNVSRQEMEQLKDLPTSPSVYISKGASDSANNFVRVKVECNLTTYDTKKPFQDVTITITLPKYYAI